MKLTRIAYGAGSVALLGLLALLARGCGGVPKPIEPAPPNDFVTRLICDRLSESNTVSEMSDVIEIAQNTGFVVQLGLELNPQRPTEFEGRQVAPATELPMMVVIYPRGSDDTDPKTLKGGVRPLFQPGGKRTWFLINDRECGYWSWAGRRTRIIPRQPVSPTSLAGWKSGKSQWYWSYMCVDKDQTGDFVFEIRLLPTASHISPVRRELGPPVVLKRGLLRVVPAAEKIDSRKDSAG